MDAKPNPLLKSDTGWQYSSSANPRRGYHDFVRYIEFNEGVTEEAQKAAVTEIMSPYKSTGGPTWAGARPQGGNSWYLNQGYDSGD